MGIIKSTILKAWAALNTNRATNLLSLCAIAISFVALISTMRQEERTVAQVRIERHTEFLDVHAVIKGLDENASLASVSPEAQSAALGYWQMVVVREILSIYHADEVYYRERILPLVVHSTRRRFLREALCTLLKGGSTLSGTRDDLLAMLDGEGVYIPECSTLVVEGARAARARQHSVLQWLTRRGR